MKRQIWIISFISYLKNLIMSIRIFSETFIFLWFNPLGITLKYIYKNRISIFSSTKFLNYSYELYKETSSIYQIPHEFSTLFSLVVARSTAIRDLIQIKYKYIHSASGGIYNTLAVMRRVHIGHLPRLFPRQDTLIFLYLPFNENRSGGAITRENVCWNPEIDRRGRLPADDGRWWNAYPSSRFSTLRSPWERRKRRRWVSGIYAIFANTSSDPSQRRRLPHHDWPPRLRNVISRCF